MADTFDPYRESLVIETETVWPAECEITDEANRSQIAKRLHESAKEAAQLEYIRMHTGFCRRIVVTPNDLERLSAGVK